MSSVTSNLCSLALLSLGDENVTTDWLGNNVRLISCVHTTYCHW